MRRDAKPYDATTKYLLEADPAGWLEYVGLGRPASTSIIDADLATVTSAADKVIRANDPLPWLGHLELQSSRDPLLPDRLLQYNVLLRSRHSLPVQSAVVMLRPEADHPGLTGINQHHHVSGDCYLEFHYHVVRVWQVPVESMLTGGIGTLPLAPLAAVSPDELPQVIRRMERRLSAEITPADAASLWSATYILMGLRYPSEVTNQLLRGVRAMKESVTYQAILEEGREEGREEGALAGRIAEARRMLIILGSKRFGAPSDEILASLERVSRIEEMEQLAALILDVESWADLLASELNG